MDAAELRARQAPLKDAYRADPSVAVTPVSGSGSFADPGITCTVESFAGPVRAGLHRATGGDGSDACSGDLLLEALATSTERYCAVGQSLRMPPEIVVRRAQPA